MKRTIMFLTVLCTTILFVQCRKSEILPSEGEMTDVVLRVENGSKTIIDGSGLVSWEKNDLLYVVGETDGLLGYLSAESDGVSVCFSGSIKKGSGTQKFHYYYLGGNAFTIEGDIFSFSIETQDGTFGNICKNLHLMHGVSGKSISVGEYNLGTVEMSSMISLTRMKFDVSGTVNCFGGCATAAINVKSGEITAAAVKKITLGNVRADVDYYMVLWATKNLGATNSAGDNNSWYGDYYAWGEVVHYYNYNGSWYNGPLGCGAEVNTATYGYAWKTYCNNTSGIFSEWSNCPYGSDNVLLPARDAARYEKHKHWHIPTKEEFDELMDADKCTFKKLSSGSTDSGTGFKAPMRGNLYVQKVPVVNNSNYIFIPDAGLRTDNDVSYQGTAGAYWTSTRNPNVEKEALYYNILSSNSTCNIGQMGRYRGHPIRPVY